MTIEFLSANHAAAKAATLAGRANRGARGFGGGIYPITPQSECIELLCQQEFEKGSLVRVESEHSAMGVCMGYALSGARTFTASSSNGLAYMTENIFAASYYRLPIVMMAVNRTLGPPWNIWVDHAGQDPYRDQDTLEILTQEYDVIIFKHCFPVSDVEPDTGEADISSDRKSIENYVLQYEALKSKLHDYPEQRFIVWTGAAQTSNNTDEGSATRAREFFQWVITTWDEPGDNIYIWDFRQLETEGGLYLLDEHASDPWDSHPSDDLAELVAPLFCKRLTDVIEGRGDSGSLTGE